MKLFQREFVNPLLALAFKDGIDFIADPFYKAMEPKKEGQRWVVLIEDNNEDDEEDDVSETLAQSVTISADGPDDDEPEEETEKPLTLRDYEDKLRRMVPRTISNEPASYYRPTQKEIIHPPQKITTVSWPEEIEPCGNCIPCKTGQDCMLVINAACAAMPMSRER